MGLPLNLPLPTMQTRWKAYLDPILANPLNNSSIIKDINLVIGNNTINHLLGKTMQGFVVSDIQGISSIYRPSIYPFNSLTLTLNSSAVVTISLLVF